MSATTTRLYRLLEDNFYSGERYRCDECDLIDGDHRDGCIIERITMLIDKEARDD